MPGARGGGGGGGGGGRPQGQAVRGPGPGRVRAPHRRRRRGRSGDHVVQTGIPGLDRSEAVEIHKGETRHSHNNPQLWMGQQPPGQLPGS
eukprot:XP_022269823.1 acyl transferase 8-like [Canis lupus familiaris]